jgi:hypothetical protein
MLPVEMIYGNMEYMKFTVHFTGDMKKLPHSRPA